MGLREDLKKALSAELEFCDVRAPKHLGINTVVDRLVDEIVVVLKAQPHKFTGGHVRASPDDDKVPIVISADPLGAERAARKL